MAVEILADSGRRSADIAVNHHRDRTDQDDVSHRAPAGRESSPSTTIVDGGAEPEAQRELSMITHEAPLLRDEQETVMAQRLAVVDLSKQYGGVHALRNVSLEVNAGEVLGLVGDNGAGKSTLLKILAGAQPPSGGSILLDGEEVAFPTPHAAKEAGIATVYQDLALAGQRDVVSNFFMGRELRSKHPLGRVLGWLDRKAMREHTVRELARLGTRIPDVSLAANELSGGQRQALAIARAAAWTSKVLLLDEPTSALGVEQQAHVLELIQRVKEEGIAVVFISHQMQDVMAVCDRAVVLRLGRVVKTLGPSELTSENLVGYITGAKLAEGEGQPHGDGRPDSQGQPDGEGLAGQAQRSR
jgi:ABC-type sugar transport system ATPase subunit